jgi:protein-arginine kinase activator protein McsA
MDIYLIIYINKMNQSINHIINAVTTIQRKWREKQEYLNCCICNETFWIQHLNEHNNQHFCADCYWWKGPGNKSYWRRKNEHDKET